MLSSVGSKVPVGDGFDFSLLKTSGQRRGYSVVVKSKGVIKIWKELICFEFALKG